MKLEITNIPSEFDRYNTTLELLEACQASPMSEYPLPEDRWHISTDAWDVMAETGVITVPDGPWNVWKHSDREKAAADGRILDLEHPENIDPTKKAAWRKEYSLVTDEGLPVHPMAKLGVTTEIFDEQNGILRKLGMATGIGREWRYGAIETGALLLARLGMHGEIEYPAVTELRDKKMRRYFPGGYAEQGENIAETCIREAREEIDIITVTELAGVPWSVVQAQPHKLWRMNPSITGPCTLNTWLAEHFLAVDATSIPDMQGVTLQAAESGIKQVRWYSGQELAKDSTLPNSHRRALLAHMKAIHTK